MERSLEFAIEPRDHWYQVTFADFFMVALEHAYRELIEAVPPLLDTRWSFEIAR